MRYHASRVMVINMSIVSMATNASAAASVPGHVRQESGCSWKTNRWNKWNKERQKLFLSVVI